MSDWQEFAACIGKPPDWFFPDGHENTTLAKQVCRTCPVIADCYAEHLHEIHGVWAGLSPMERRRIRTGEQQRSRMVRHVCPCGAPYSAGPLQTLCPDCKATRRALQQRVSKMRRVS